jgi:hypothetical protein
VTHIKVDYVHRAAAAVKTMEDDHGGLVWRHVRIIAIIEHPIEAQLASVVHAERIPVQEAGAGSVQLVLDPARGRVVERSFVVHTPHPHDLRASEEGSVVYLR